MASVLELIEKIVEEQRSRQKHEAGLETNALQQEATRLGIESSRFDLDAKQRKFRGDLELATRRYPGLDPVEALVRMQADDEAEERDVKRRAAEGAIGYKESLELAARGRAAVSADKVEKTPTEIEAEVLKNVNAEKRGAVQDAILARIMQQLEGRYNPDRNAPDAGKGQGKEPKRYKPKTTEYKEARAALMADPRYKTVDPTPAEIRARAYEMFGSEDQLPPGGSRVPTPPPDPTASLKNASSECPNGMVVYTSPSRGRYCGPPKE